MPCGLPSTSTTAASAFSSTDIRLVTVSPEPTTGSGLDITRSRVSDSWMSPAKTPSSSSFSATEPITSPAMMSGWPAPGETTGICETPYSRSTRTASATVSLGCMWTNCGMPSCSMASLRASTSPMCASSVADGRKP